MSYPPTSGQHDNSGSGEQNEQHTVRKTITDHTGPVGLLPHEQYRSYCRTSTRSRQCTSGSGFQTISGQELLEVDGVDTATA